MRQLCTYASEIRIQISTQRSCTPAPWAWERSRRPRSGTAAWTRTRSISPKTGHIAKVWKKKLRIINKKIEVYLKKPLRQKIFVNKRLLYYLQTGKRDALLEFSTSYSKNLSSNVFSPGLVPAPSKHCLYSL